MKPAVISIVFTILILFVGIYYSWFAQAEVIDDIQIEHPISIRDEESEVTPSGEIVNDVRISNDKNGAKVDPEDLSQGCLLGKDCIPSIDNPSFETPDEANAWLNADDIVFGVNHKGTQKAYPQRILNWHEIVNDRIANDPIAITFCPLCGTAVSFIRKVDSEVTQFGVSGKLYNSDLIMYDRLEGSLWQQATGEAIIGPAARRDEILEKVSTTTTTWQQWREKYPETLVLALDTGFSRDYSKYPYGTYEDDGEIYFGVENLDTTLHVKEIVYGINVNGQAKAYRESRIKTEKSFEDEVNGQTIQIEYLQSGELTFTNIETEEVYVPIRGFWFAWAAFNPDTEIY